MTPTDTTSTTCEVDPVTSTVARTETVAPRALVLLLALVAIAHAPALLGPFVLDDNLLVTENPRRGDFSSVLGFFVEPVVAYLPGGVPNVYYRPLSFVSLWIDWTIWGENPLGFHLTNLLLHLGSTWLVLRLVRRWWGRAAWLPFTVAGIWSLLPINVEPVAYIAARHDVLFNVLYLLALDVYTGGTGRRRLVLFSLTAIAAFFAKEMAVTLPVAAVLHDVLLGRRGREWLSVRLPCCLGTLAVLLGVRFLVTASADTGSDPAPGLAAPDLLLVTSVAWHYVTMLLGPLEYSIDRSRDVVGDAGSAGLFGGFVVVSVLFLVATLRGAPSPQRRLVAFGVLWGVVAYLPVSNLVPLYTVCADRYLYLPALGFVLAVTVALSHLFGRHAVVRGTSVAVLFMLLILAAFSFNRSLVFASEERLYRVSLETSDSAMLHNNHGLVLKRAGDFPGAARAFAGALEVTPAYHEARFNLGVLARERGDLDAAESLLWAYVDALPQAADGRLQLGLVALACEAFDTAVARLERARQLAPTHLGTAYHLAVALWQAGHRDRAREVLEGLPPRDRAHPGVRRLLDQLAD